MSCLVKPCDLEVGELYWLQDTAWKLYPTNPAKRTGRWEPVVITAIWSLPITNGILMYEYMKGDGSLRRIHDASFDSVELKRLDDDCDMVPPIGESK